MHTRSLLRWFLVLALLGLGCSSGPDPFVPVDGGDETDTGDFTDTQPPIDSYTPTDLGRDTTVPIDTAPPVDVPIDRTPPVDIPADLTMPIDIPIDRVPPPDGCTVGMCPSTCSFNSDCDRCWGSCDTRTGTYCCQSGMCMYSAGGTCGVVPTDVPGTDGDLDAGTDDSGSDDVGVDDASIE